MPETKITISGEGDQLSQTISDLTAKFDMMREAAVKSAREAAVGSGYEDLNARIRVLGRNFEDNKRVVEDHALTLRQSARGVSVLAGSLNEVSPLLGRVASAMTGMTFATRGMDTGMRTMTIGVGLAAAAFGAYMAAINNAVDAQVKFNMSMRSFDIGTVSGSLMAVNAELEKMSLLGSKIAAPHAPGTGFWGAIKEGASSLAARFLTMPQGAMELMGLTRKPEEVQTDLQQRGRTIFQVTQGMQASQFGVQAAQAQFGTYQAAMGAALPTMTKQEYYAAMDTLSARLSAVEAAEIALAERQFNLQKARGIETGIWDEQAARNTLGAQVGAIRARYAGTRTEMIRSMQNRYGAGLEAGAAGMPEYGAELRTPPGVEYQQGVTGRDPSANEAMRLIQQETAGQGLRGYVSDDILARVDAGAIITPMMMRQIQIGLRQWKDDTAGQGGPSYFTGQAGSFLAARGRAATSFQVGQQAAQIRMGAMGAVGGVTATGMAMFGIGQAEAGVASAQQNVDAITKAMAALTEQYNKGTIEDKDYTDQREQLNAALAAGNDQIVLQTANLEKMRAEWTAMTDPVAGFVKGLGDIQDEFQALGLRMKSFAEGTATSMQRAFSDIFFDGLTGKFKELPDVAKNFGLSMVRTFSDELSKLTVAPILGALKGLFSTGMPAVIPGTVGAGAAAPYQEVGTPIINSLLKAFQGSQGTLPQVAPSATGPTSTTGGGGIFQQLGGGGGGTGISGIWNALFGGSVATGALITTGPLAGSTLSTIPAGASILGTTSAATGAGATGAAGSGAAYGASTTGTWAAGAGAAAAAVGGALALGFTIYSALQPHQTTESVIMNTLSGALAGAVIGSLGGPIGVAIGAVAGAAIGGGLSMLNKDNGPKEKPGTRSLRRAQEAANTFSDRVANAGTLEELVALMNTPLTPYWNEMYVSAPGYIDVNNQSPWYTEGPHGKWTVDLVHRPEVVDNIEVWWGGSGAAQRDEQMTAQLKGKIQQLVAIEGAIQIGYREMIGGVSRTTVIPGYRRGEAANRDLFVFAEGITGWDKDTTLTALLQQLAAIDYDHDLQVLRREGDVDSIVVGRWTAGSFRAGS